MGAFLSAAAPGLVIVKGVLVTAWSAPPITPRKSVGPKSTGVLHPRMIKGLFASSSQPTKNAKGAPGSHLRTVLRKLLVGFCARHDWSGGLAALQRR